MTITGTAFKYGDDVDTDVIIPARHLTCSDPKHLAAHCMEDIDATFARKVRRGDIIVAGRNFGCGSSREHAPLAIAASGISCVIASSFARIFYRNAINTGLAILECPGAAGATAAGDTLCIDFAKGIIRNESTGQVFTTAPFPPFIQSIIDAGGLLNTLPAEE